MRRILVQSPADWAGAASGEGILTMTAPLPSSVTFADLLRYHRMVACLTQGELAGRGGLSLDAISTRERGARRRPRKDPVVLLAEALSLPAEERAAFAAAARRSLGDAVAAPPVGVLTTAATAVVAAHV